MNRNKNIIVRVTSEELFAIKEKSKRLGLSISAFLRMLALKEK
jgi:predicted DNA binding CopG/RHH family protein